MTADPHGSTIRTDTASGAGVPEAGERVATRWIYRYAARMRGHQPRTAVAEWRLYRARRGR